MAEEFGERKYPHSAPWWSAFRLITENDPTSNRDWELCRFFHVHDCRNNDVTEDTPLGPIVITVKAREFFPILETAILRLADRIRSELALGDTVPWGAGNDPVPDSLGTCERIIKVLCCRDPDLGDFMSVANMEAARQSQMAVSQKESTNLKKNSVQDTSDWIRCKDVADKLVDELPSLNYPNAKSLVTKACNDFKLECRGKGNNRRIDPRSARRWIAELQAESEETYASGLRKTPRNKQHSRS